MLFTNGTGTGKTFTGLGVVKRAVRQGKTNILIAVPSDKIAADWIESGVPLGLEISKLKDTKDAGRGIVVTTYANLGANDALASREWDMVVADEAHKLMQAEDGTPTTYLENLRAITLHPDGAHQRYAMLNREDIDRMKALSSQIDFNTRIANADDTMDEHRAALIKENTGLEKEHKALADKLAQAREEVRGYVAERQGAARPRLVALSATPFAYMKTVDWANGYLFDYHEGQPEDGASGTGGRPYNSGSNRERFFMQHFGYSMRYNKLNEPDPAKVDVGLLQRQFNAWLKKKGSLSGRQLEVNADYDRRFVLVDSAIGNQIDEALNWLSENARNAPKDDRGFYELRDRINDKFDYLNRRYLLEAIKATEAIPIVKAHMAMGRKVIVFHDYLQGGGFNPFNVPPMTVSADGNAEDRARAEQFNAALRQFNAKFSALVNAPLGEMTSPIDVFKRELPQVLLINGSENPKEKLKRYKVFQDDASGPQVMLVQSAQNAGWSGHDTTGKHQRVLINIGQPTAPTMAIQQEGRIYRVGQVSNAIMRYLNTGTSWEKWAFAQTIATRASAAENLGAGELSRALKDSFIAAFEESDAYPPGHEGEGTGGKERDKAQNNALTAYDRAKTFYWATQKKNGRTKAQEGVDYFATPEPVGFKMVEWLDLRGGEDSLEPSGGHGAIARWLPDSVQRTVIEPSPALRSRLAMVMDLGNDRIIDGTFEDLAVVNKFDGIVMNPPFGVGGKTAIEHLEKAATHLRDGGRIVALIPTGPAADKRFEKWMNGEETREVKPLFEHPTLGPIYRGDTIESRAAWAPSGVVMRTNRDGGLWVKVPGRAGETTVSSESITGIAAQGPRSETYRPAEGLHQVAEVRLPQVTFERAGTAVATRIVVIDKHRDPAKAPNPRSPIDLTGISDIRELFDRLENMDLPARSMTAEQEASAKAEQGRPAAPTPAATQPAADQGTPQGPVMERKGRKIVEHVTKNGKTLRGIVAADITKDQAQEIDPYTFKKDGGWFIRERHIKDDAAAPKFSRSSRPLPDTITIDGVARPTTNSKGQPIHPTEEGLRNFWRWFGDSKAVDDQGRPLVMYHGTSASEDGDAFTSFDTYGSNYGLMGAGGYFTADPVVASSYTTKGKGATPSVYPVYLRVTAPIDMDAKADAPAWRKQFDGSEVFHEGGDTNESWYRAAEDGLRDQGVPKWEGAEAMQDGIRAMGFDGITHIGGGRIQADSAKHRVFIVFDPEQVKSASGNTGAFSAQSPDIRFSNSPDEPTPTGITYDALPGAFAKRFPKLAGAIKTMLHRGALGQKGGLVVLDSNDSADIAREFASRTGWDYRETMEMFESVDGAGVHAIYDPKTGTTFAIGPNLDEASLPSVILHEAYHGQQRQNIDAKALALIQGRAKEAPALRAFLDRVAERMEQVGEADNRFEAAPYIVEMAVTEGRSAGFSAADGPILAWIEKNIGRKVADLVRGFVATLRAWALAHGVPLKSVTVDDLVAYAQAGVRKAAKGRVLTVQDDGARRSMSKTPETLTVDGVERPTTNSKGQRIHPTDDGIRNFWRWFGDSKAVDEQGRPLVVYHGTPRTFSVFQPSRAGNFGGGIYLASDLNQAEEFAYGDDGGDNIMPVFVSMQRPFITEADYAAGDEADVDSPAVPLIRAIYGKDANKVIGRIRNSDNGYLRGAVQSRLQEMGHDGIVATYPDGTAEYIAFTPEQIKSAIGNSGAFDPSNPNIQFSRSGALRAATRAATDALADTFTAPGKLSWWHKTVGTMYNLAERSPYFAPVFRAAQGFIDDVSHYANDAAEQAPKLLPKLDNWRDIWKSPISAADNTAIAKPIFEGTLMWTRDANGRPVRVADDEADSAGIVWHDSELRSMFGLSDAQVALYREFRAATNRSVDSMTRADMLRYGGKDAKPVRDAVMDARDLTAATSILRQHFRDLARAEPDRAETLTAAVQGIEDRASRGKMLMGKGYAPLSRFGRYTVDVVKDGKREYFGLFETAREANQMAARMRREFGIGSVTQGMLSQEAFKLFAGVTPETLELFGNALGLDSTGDEARDKAFQEYLRLTKSNRSAMKRMMHRQGIAGYSEDVARVLASFVYSNARQTAAGLNIGDLGEAVQAIPKEQGDLKDAAFRLADYVKNPQEEAQAIRGLLFAQYLGGSIASAFVNMTQPAAVTFPWLSQFGGAKAAATQLAKAAADMAKKRYEPGLARALHLAEEDGTVSPQEVHQLMAQAQGSGALRSGDGTKQGEALALASNGLKRLAFAWGKVFGMAEQTNRRITFIAAYRTAVERGMSDPAKFARKAVQETQFVYSKASKQQWGRGAVGGTLMTFKTYSIAYLELLHRMATQGGPEGKRAALLALGVLMLMGGVGGLPFAGDAEDIADALARLLGYNISVKKARQELLEDAFGRGIAGFIDKGITGLPGAPLDVSGRLGMGNLIPGTGLLQPKSSHTADMLEIVGPVGDLTKRAFEGAGKLLQGDVAGAALQVAPTAVRNAAKGVDMASTGMYRDAKGYKVLDTDGLEAALKTIGFQPKSVAAIQEANAEAQQAKNFYNLRAQEIRAKWAQGVFENDPDKVQEARDEVADWNRKNPDQRMVIAIPSVMKKVQEMRKSKDERIAATAPKAMRASLREELGKVREGL